MYIEEMLLWENDAIVKWWQYNDTTMKWRNKNKKYKGKGQKGNHVKVK